MLHQAIQRVSNIVRYDCARFILKGTEKKFTCTTVFYRQIENVNNTSQINIRLRSIYCLSRWLTCCSYVDYDTVAGADKFGNVFVVSISRT